MTDRYVDLHVHTNYSDGSFSPEEVMRHAKKLGFSAIGIADHDEVGGVDAATRAGRALSVEVIPSVELTAGFDDKEIHILGLLIDHNDHRLRERLQGFRRDRYNRMESMVRKLNELGLQISMRSVRELAGHGSLGRLHLARTMFEEKLIGNVQQAFDQYIGVGKEAYSQKPRIELDEAFEMINSAGGMPVLAHPKLARMDDKIPELARRGLRGIEAYYTWHTPEETSKYVAIAEANNLLITGGSDCHGVIKKKMLLGSIKLPYSRLDALRELSK